jgi:uncharacterized protein YjdB
MKRNMKTTLAWLGFARLASDPLIALTLIFLSLPCLLSAQTLEHRYSFVSDATDSVGAANGTIVPPTTGGAATIANGLNLPGNAGGGNGVSGYVSLPNGIVKGDTNVTVECWVQPSSVNTWAEIWDFGSSGSINFALIQDSPGGGGQMRVAFTPNGGEHDIDALSGDLPSGSEAYVVVTYNNSTLTGNLYLNGALDGSVVLPNATYSPGAYGGASGTTEDTFGNDVFGDPQFGGTIYEVRIWSGVVSERYIGASALLGSTVLVTNLTPTSATLTAGSNVVVTGTLQANVTVQLAQTGTANVPATSDATNWTSGNTNVLTVNSGGLVTGVSPGTTTIGATVGGIACTSGSITVVPFSLLNRYSFISDASDSVGGANGTLVPPNGGAAATINNGLSLPGNTGGGFGVSGYVSLPTGLLVGTTSLTIECWVTENTRNTWATVWDFGNNGNQNFALIPDPNNNNGNMEVAFNPDNNDIYTASAAAFPTNSEQYVCLTYNNSTLTGSLYTNGVLDVTQAYPGTNYSPGGIGGAGGTTENMLGNDVYGDEQFDGTVYEFRIWNGAVSPVYIAVSSAAGSSVVVTNLTPLSLTVDLAVTNMIGAQTQQATVVGNFSAAAGVTVTGGATNWTSSKPNILSVSSSGLITALSGGNATVSATVNGVTATSAPIIVALTAPIITQQPVSQVLVVGQSATFTVVALGGDLFYQWSEGSAPIPGATNPTLTLTNLALTNAGSYSVLVTNALGSTNSVTVTLSVDLAILQHRYSFISDASDSVGTANGTLMAPNGGGAATINNGLMLPGNPGGGNGVSGYVALPNGIVAGDSSISVECWVQPNSVNTWAEIWDFGSSGSVNFALIQDSPGPGDMRVAFTPHGNEVDIDAPTYLPAGAEQYILVTYNNATLTGDLYTNGVLDGTVILPDTTYSPGSYGGAGGTTDNSFGNDVFGDPQFGGTIYEVRVWNGVVSPLYIALSALAGPSVVVTNLTPLSVSVIVTNTMNGEATQQAVVMATFATATNVTVTAAVTNWTSSDTNVLIVNATGLITAVGGGSATISAEVAGITGTSVVITVPLTAPTITQEPAATANILAGGTLHATVVNNGLEPYSYSWFFNVSAQPISGATAATLTIPNVQAANAGSYTVVVSNPYGSVTSTPTVLTVITPTPYQESLLALNPLGYWPLDETSGTIAYDVAGGYNGTYVGNVSLGQTGPTNAGFGPISLGAGFDGATAYVDIPEGPFNITNAVTLMAWVNVQAYPTFAGLFGHGDTSYRTSVNGSGEPGANNGTLPADATSPNNILDGNWHFVLYTYTGNTNNSKNGSLYVDGALVANNSVGANPAGNALDVWIGGAPDYGTARLLNANIAHAAIFAQAFTAADVQALYSGQPIIGVTRSGSSLVLTWSSGTLLQAPSLLGPWTTNTAAVSPYTVLTTNGAEFYKVVVP